MHSRHKCVVCQTEYEPFMSFGRMPTANGFLLPEEFPTVYFFELKVGFCHNCAVVQLAELVVAGTKILIKTDAIVMFEDPYLGYFCHKFEEEKFDCYAVENDRENLHFLKILKRAENRGF